MFDSNIPYVDEAIFIAFYKQMWKELYPDTEEAIPFDELELKGKPLKLSVYNDFDHARIFLTGWSHNGIIIYINNALINWFGKQKITVETSTFGYEFIVINIKHD